MNKDLLEFKWLENDKPFFCFIPEFYYSIGQRKFSRLANSQASKYRTILHYLPSGSQILDPCSGSGFGAKMLQDSGHIITCVEQNPFLIEVLKTRGLKTILCEDVRKLQFPKNSFDGIVFIDAIEHFFQKDQESLLRYFYCILRPGGVLVIDTPYSKRTRYVNVEHKRELSWEDFESVVRGALFTGIERYLLVWDQFSVMYRINDPANVRPLICGPADQIIVATKV